MLFFGQKITFFHVFKALVGIAWSLIRSFNLQAAALSVSRFNTLFLRLQLAASALVRQLVSRYYSKGSTERHPMVLTATLLKAAPKGQRRRQAGQPASQPAS